jgi:hypothetical protein
VQIFNHITPPLTLADKTKRNFFVRLLKFTLRSLLSSLGCSLCLNSVSNEMFDIMKSKDIRFIYKGMPINLVSTFNMQGAPEAKLNIFSNTPTINDMNSYLSGLEVFPSPQIVQQSFLLCEWVTNKSADPKLVKSVTTFVVCLRFFVVFS